MTITKIISGGQTGADQAGLAAAKELGLQTGGWMPKGWVTDEGYRPEFEFLYKMRQTSTATYPPRTRFNVAESDGTLIFGNSDSRGSVLIARYCYNFARPIYKVAWFIGVSDDIILFRAWVRDKNIRTLNVAGNRESRAPGIFDACKAFLIKVLTP
jgi:hypothetical protein